jgi:hypothetical protein
MRRPIDPAPSRVRTAVLSSLATFAFVATGGCTIAGCGPRSMPSAYASSQQGANPCAAADPCAAEAACAADPCAAANPCAVDPCAANPCAAACAPCDPCAANPCAAACAPCGPCAANPCAAACAPCGPCAANPCAAACAPCGPCGPCAAACAPCGPCGPCGPCAAAPVDDPEALQAATDYTGWTKVNDDPVMSATHGNRWVFTYLNARAEQAGLTGDLPFPTGSVLAKESFTNDNGSVGGEGPLFLMTKREAGYDSDHNDWQYAIVAGNKVQMSGSGKPGQATQFCAQCHQAVAGQDYVYGIGTRMKLGN